MAKRSSRRPSISELARTLQKADRDLLKQINQRAKLAEKLARARDAAGEETYRPEEESQAIHELTTSNRGPLSDVCVQSLFRELASGSRALYHKLRVTFLGPAHSYSHLAVSHYFGQSIELAPVSSIAAVFEEVNRHQADYGVVPLENSTDGRISDTLQMFVRLPVKICGEIQLKIHHYLLARCRRSEIREVYSKPQALSQCRDWLTRHLPGVRLVEMTSTAAAAKLASEKQGAAAVASREAGVKYGLETIDARIEDNRNNLTRFAVIGYESAKRTGRDKTSLLFEVPHAPGSLADAMAVFKRNQLNLTWIESFPVAGTANEYLFFVELEGHLNEAKVKRAVNLLEKKAVRLDVLGSYPRGQVAE